MNSTQRFFTLDGIRGVAAISVMFYHFTQHTSQPIMQNAALAVDLFFCLSGFVVAYSYSARLKNDLSAWGFVKKRLIRLYPMYVIGLSIGLVALFAKVFSAQTSLTLDNAFVSAISNLFYMPYVNIFYIKIGNTNVPSAIFPVNDPAWSLFFELMVNVFFAIFVFVPKPFNHTSFVFFASIFTLLVYSILTRHAAAGWGADNIFGGVPRTWFGFFLGVFLFELSGLIKKRLPKVDPVLLLLLTVGVFLIPHYGKPYNGITWLLGVFIIVPLIVAVGSKSKTDNRHINWIANYLGWISYPLYCVHFPVYSLFTTITNNRDCGLSGALMCGVVSWGVAHYSSKHIEEPIRRWLGANSRDLKTN